MNIILIGPQGAGKGTQASLLEKKYHLQTIEMGAILREKAQERTDRGKLINHLINEKGKLLPDGIVIEIVKEHLKNNSHQHGYLFDGYPRNTKQFILLEDTLLEQDQYINLAIYLDITDQVGIERLSNRRICQKCHKIYNLKTDPPPQKNTCSCGGKLYQREDDQPEAIKTRLNIFHQVTVPLLEVLKTKRILFKVDASASPKEIHQEIINYITKHQLANT